MPYATAEFLRQSPRAPMACPVLLEVGTQGHQVLGEMIDISATGTSVSTGQPMRRGQRVTLMVDADSFLVGEQGGGLPVIAGEVTWVRRDGEREGRAVFRLGLRFTSLPDSVAARLRRLSRTGTRDSAAVVDEVALANSAAGREQLYQLALVRLAAHDHDGARAAVRASLKVIPHARHMRALLCRIDAEAALGQQQLDEAGRRIAHGRSLTPEDTLWPLLEERVQRARPSRPGLWSRLFRAS